MGCCTNSGPTLRKFGRAADSFSWCRTPRPTWVTRMAWWCFAFLRRPRRCRRRCCTPCRCSCLRITLRCRRATMWIGRGIWPSRLLSISFLYAFPASPFPLPSAIPCIPLAGRRHPWLGCAVPASTLPTRGTQETAFSWCGCAGARGQVRRAYAGAWSEGRSSLRGALSMADSVHAGASALESSTRSMRRPRLRRNPAAR